MAKGKKELRNITIESMAAEGKCIARHEGMVMFVNKVAPGDIVDLRIIKKKKKFAEATPIHFHKYSPLRVEPVCGHYGICGGCKWQHINYDEQLKFKKQQVVDQMERIGGLILPEVADTLPSAETLYYRNKLEYTFSDKRWLTPKEIASNEDFDRRGLGFHIPGRFDKVLDIEHCYLQPEPSNDIRLEVKQIAQERELTYYDLLNHSGFLRNLVIRTANTGQVMVILQVAEEKQVEITYILDRLIQKFPAITSANYIINKKRNETYYDQEVVNYSGEAFIEEVMQKPDGSGELRFRVGPKSFYQTNSEQAESLYSTAWEFAGLVGDENVYDLYTGTGTIACYISSRAKKVVGIEYVKDAVADARENAAHNKIKNTSFFAGDIKDMLTEEFFNENGFPDVVITDPPRAGMHPDVCNALLNAAPKKIVYVSCNPATQARDVALLAERYAIEKIQPVDMFPHTHHVENVVLLEKR